MKCIFDMSKCDTSRRCNACSRKPQEKIITVREHCGDRCQKYEKSHIPSMQEDSFCGAEYTGHDPQQHGHEWNGLCAFKEGY